MTEQLRQHIDAVRAELLAGKRHGDIVKRFAAEWNVSTRTVERVISKAQEEVAEEREEEEEIRREARRKRAAEIEEQRINNELEIDAALMGIITRKVRLRKIVYNMGAAEEREVEPDVNAIIRAADVYYKRQGKRDEKQVERKEENHSRFTGFRIADEDEYPDRVTGLIFEDELDEEERKLEKEIRGEDLIDNACQPDRHEQFPPVPNGYVRKGAVDNERGRVKNDQNMEEADEQEVSVYAPTPADPPRKMPPPFMPHRKGYAIRTSSGSFFYPRK